MFSKLIFIIDNEEIEIHSHEIVKIAQNLMLKCINNAEDLKNNVVNIPDYFSYEEHVNNEFKLFSNKITNYYDAYYNTGNKINCFLKYLYKYGMNGLLLNQQLNLEFFNMISKIKDSIKPNRPFINKAEYDKIILPVNISGINSISKWIFVVKYLTENYAKEPIVGWWYIIGNRLILLKNSIQDPQQHFYVTDHGSIENILQNIKNITSITAEQIQLLLGFNKFYEQLNTQQKEHLKNNFIYEINTNHCENHLFLLISLSMPKICRVKFLNSEFASVAIEVSHIGMMFSGDDGPAIQSSPTIIKNEKYKKHEQQFNAAVEIVRYTIDVKARTFYAELFFNPDRPLSPFFTQIDLIFNASDAERYKEFLVLSCIAKKLGKGIHQYLLRPIYAYGEKDKGSPYHELEKAITNYFRLPEHLDSQQLATVMREILKGRATEAVVPSFLPNLVSAWFISETIRNPVSLITGLMLLDMLENNVECIDNENGVNLYTWQKTLTHPMNEEAKINNHAETNDLYGNSIHPFKFGGSHPMAHKNSIKDAKRNLDDGTKLSVVRQKEGHLILDWLFIHIKHIQPKFSVEISNDQLAVIPKYYEINVNIKEIDEKIKKIEDTIRYKNYEDVDKQLDKISRLQKLRKKQLLINFLIEPLLKARIETLDNLYVGITLKQIIYDFRKEVSTGTTQLQPITTTMLNAFNARKNCVKQLEAEHLNAQFRLKVNLSCKNKYS